MPQSRSDHRGAMQCWEIEKRRIAVEMVTTRSFSIRDHFLEIRKIFSTYPWDAINFRAMPSPSPWSASLDIFVLQNERQR